MNPRFGRAQFDKLLLALFFTDKHNHAARIEEAKSAIESGISVSELFSLSDIKSSLEANGFTVQFHNQNDENVDKQSALHLACQYSSVDMVRLLLNYQSADVNQITHHGETCLALLAATALNPNEKFTLLMQHGANLFATNPQGASILGTYLMQLNAGKRTSLLAHALQALTSELIDLAPPQFARTILRAANIFASENHPNKQYLLEKSQEVTGILFNKMSLQIANDPSTFNKHPLETTFTAAPTLRCMKLLENIDFQYLRDPRQIENFIFFYYVLRLHSCNDNSTAMLTSFIEALEDKDAFGATDCLANQYLRACLYLMHGDLRSAEKTIKKINAFFLEKTDFATNTVLSPKVWRRRNNLNSDLENFSLIISIGRAGRILFTDDENESTCDKLIFRLNQALLRLTLLAGNSALFKRITAPDFKLPVGDYWDNHSYLLHYISTPTSLIKRAFNIKSSFKDRSKVLDILLPYLAKENKLEHFLASTNPEGKNFQAFIEELLNFESFNPHRIAISMQEREQMKLHMNHLMSYEKNTPIVSTVKLKDEVIELDISQESAAANATPFTLTRPDLVESHSPQIAIDAIPPVEQDQMQVESSTEQTVTAEDFMPPIPEPVINHSAQNQLLAMPMVFFRPLVPLVPVVFLSPFILRPVVPVAAPALDLVPRPTLLEDPFDNDTFTDLVTVLGKFSARAEILGISNTEQHPFLIHCTQLIQAIPVQDAIRCLYRVYSSLANFKEPLLLPNAYTFSTSLAKLSQCPHTFKKNELVLVIFKLASQLYNLAPADKKHFYLNSYVFSSAIRASKNCHQATAFVNDAIGLDMQNPQLMATYIVKIVSLIKEPLAIGRYLHGWTMGTQKELPALKECILAELEQFYGETNFFELIRNNFPGLLPDSLCEEFNFRR